MAYEPKTWVCGETITADGLNHMEQGIAECCSGGGGTLVVIKPTGETESVVEGDMSCTRYYYDMTYAELFETMKDGTIVFAQFPIPTGETSNLLGVEQIQIVSVPFNETPSMEEKVMLAYNSGLSVLYTNESGKLYTKHCIIV